VAAVRAILSTLHDLTHGRAALLAYPWRDSAALAVAEPAPHPWEGEYAHAGVEPPLEDLLQDPLVLRVMQADHVPPAQVRRLLGVRQRPVAL
jgi:hypothetical protein